MVAELRPDLDDADDQDELATVLSTSAAFHQWRQAKLKATFKRQLTDILEDVSAEEHAKKQLMKELQQAQAGERELQQQITCIKAELTATAVQLCRQLAREQDQQHVYETFQQQHAAVLQRAEAAEAQYAAEVQRGEIAKQQHKQQLDALKQEQQGLLQQQQHLLDALAQRDQSVAQLASQLQSVKQTAAAAECQSARMEGIVRATGERAAAAEDDLRTSHEVVLRLQEQLAELKDRYHKELEGLHPLRTAAAESAQFKQRLADTSAAAAALAAARGEMQRSLDSAVAELAAANERAWQLEASVGVQQTIAAMVDRYGNVDGLAAALSQQLDTATAKLAQAASGLAAAQAVNVQQQRHIERLAGEAATAQQGQAAATEHGEVLQVLNVQLQAEVARLLALVELHDTQRLHAEPTASTISSQAQTAILLSQLQEALDTVMASRRSMARSKPKVIAAARLVRAATAVTDQIAAVLQHVIAASVLQQQQQQEQQQPAVLAAAVQRACQQLQPGWVQQINQQRQMLANLQWQLQQQHQYWQQRMLPAVESACQALKQAIQQCAQLNSSGSSSRSVVEAVQTQLRDAERQLANVLNAAASVNANGSSADEQHIAAEVAVRDVCATLLDISRLLERVEAVDALNVLAAERIMEEVVVRSAVAASRCQEISKAVGSYVVKMAASAAELASVLAYLHTAQQQSSRAVELLQQLEQLLGAKQQQQRSQLQGQQPASAVPTDAPAAGDTASGTAGVARGSDDKLAAVQLEVAALKLQMQRREQAVQELMAREKQLLSGTSELVPVDLLTAARASQEQATHQITALQQHLEAQAAAQQDAASAYVDRVCRWQAAALIWQAWLAWRLAAATGRAGRLLCDLETCQEARKHSQTLHQLRSAALAAFLKGQAKSLAAAAQQQLTAALLAAWQRQVNRQIKATWHWKGLAELFLQQTAFRNWVQYASIPASIAARHTWTSKQAWSSNVSHRAPHYKVSWAAAPEAPQSAACTLFSMHCEPPQMPENKQHGEHGVAGLEQEQEQQLLATREQELLQQAQAGQPSYIQRLLQRRRQPAGSCAAATADERLLLLSFGAWRALARLLSDKKALDQAQAQIESISIGLPAWIKQLGDRRRLERAWLAWRLTVAAAAAHAAKAAAAATARPASALEAVIGQQPASANVQRMVQAGSSGAESSPVVGSGVSRPIGSCDGHNAAALVADHDHPGEQQQERWWQRWQQPPRQHHFVLQSQQGALQLTSQQQRTAGVYSDPTQPKWLIADVSAAGQSQVGTYSLPSPAAAAFGQPTACKALWPSACGALCDSINVTRSNSAAGSQLGNAAGADRILAGNTSQIGGGSNRDAVTPTPVATALISDSGAVNCIVASMTHEPVTTGTATAADAGLKNSSSPGQPPWRPPSPHPHDIKPRVNAATTAKADTVEQQQEQHQQHMHAHNSHFQARSGAGDCIPTQQQQQHERVFRGGAARMPSKAGSSVSPSQPGQSPSGRVARSQTPRSTAVSAAGTNLHSSSSERNADNQQRRRQQRISLRSDSNNKALLRAGTPQKPSSALQLQGNSSRTDIHSRSTHGSQKAIIRLKAASAPAAAIAAATHATAAATGRAATPPSAARQSQKVASAGSQKYHRCQKAVSSPEAIERLAAPKMVSPPQPASGPVKAAFGHTVKPGSWVPVISAAQGSTLAAVVAAAATGGGATSRAHPAMAVPASPAPKHWVERSDAASGGGNNWGASSDAASVAVILPAAAAAGDKNQDAGAAVCSELTGITNTLAAMQAKVLEHSRAIFQGGADALHPSPIKQQEEQHLQRRQRQPEPLPVGMQQYQQDALRHTSGAVHVHQVHEGMSSSPTACNKLQLQQQLAGYQQHLQQITSSLRFASRPWLYMGNLMQQNASEHGFEPAAVAESAAADSIAADAGECADRGCDVKQHATEQCTVPDNSAAVDDGGGSSGAAGNAHQCSECERADNATPVPQAAAAVPQPHQPTSAATGKQAIDAAGPTADCSGGGGSCANVGDTPADKGQQYMVGAIKQHNASLLQQSQPTAVPAKSGAAEQSIKAQGIGQVEAIADADGVVRFLRLS